MKHIFSTLFLVVILSACQNITPKKPIEPSYNFSPEWQVRQKELTQSLNWKTLGKLGVRTDADSGSASLTWLQKNNDLRIELSGPLGQGRLSIRSEAGQLSLFEAGKDPIHANSAEALLLKATGWRVPVAELSYWIRALPDPNHPIELEKANQQGHLGELKQLDWQINFLDYIQVETLSAAKQFMPTRIVAQYAKNPKIKLTLVVREWQFGVFEE